MTDIDELCDSFAANMKTVEEHEVDILEKLIYNIENTKYTNIRTYLNEIAYHMDRYYNCFIKDMSNKNEVSYYMQIKSTSEEFRNMWGFFRENEHSSSPSDLLVLMGKALESLRWVKKSIDTIEDEYSDHNYDDYDSDEYGDLEYGSISRDYEDIQKNY